MSKAIAILLFTVGVINFLPVLGVLSGARVSQAYGIEIMGGDLEILLRHRALLFGVIGAFIIFSVFVPAYQTAAMIMGGVSMFGYVFFMWQVGDYNGALHKIMLVDLAGIACLLGAAALKFLVAD